MKYYDRLLAIEISPDIHIEGLKVKFNVKKDIEPDRNFFRLDIYNLSEETRNRISSNPEALVRLQAGYFYNGGLVEICQGNISTISHSITKPDTITTINCKDGFKAIRGNLISISFKENTPLSTIINTLTDKLGLPIRFVEYDGNQLLQGGFSYLGSINDCMDVLSEKFDFEWSIQNGQLQILPDNKNTGRQVVVLSPATGLLSEPEEVVLDKELEDHARGEHEVIALLQPQMQVGDIVFIESRNINGRFTVKDLEHIGDTRGDEWLTKMKVAQSG